MFRSLISVTAALVWLCAPTNTSAEPFINQIMVNGIKYAYHTDAYFKNLRETFCTAIHSDHKWYCDQDTEELEKRWHKRSEEHTSELQSQFHIVCRLLLDTHT